MPEGITEQQLYEKFFLPVRVIKRNRDIPDWQYVHTELRKKGVTLQLLWREYREQPPDGVRYSQFCHLYYEYRKQISPSMRQTHKAGEKIFVDYAGQHIEYIEPYSGEVLQAEVFVGCLGASQYIFPDFRKNPKYFGNPALHFTIFSEVGKY